MTNGARLRNLSRRIVGPIIINRRRIAHTKYVNFLYRCIAWVISSSSFHFFASPRSDIFVFSSSLSFFSSLFITCLDCYSSGFSPYRNEEKKEKIVSELQSDFWLVLPGRSHFKHRHRSERKKIKFLDNLEHGIRCREFRSLDGDESCTRICLVLWSNACWTSERSFEMRFDAMVWDFAQGSIFFFARPQRTSRVCATKRESHHCSQVAEPHAYPLSIDRLAIFDFAFIAARSPIQKCVTINSPLINFACLAFVPKELLEMNRRAHRTCANNNGGWENRYTPRFCYDAHRTWIANRIKFQFPQEMSSKRR